MSETKLTPADNPYSTPSSEAGIPARIQFQDIPTKELKTLRNDSHTVRTIAVLLMLGLLVISILLISRIIGGSFELGPEDAVLLVFATWYSFVLTGLIKRTNWGRILGFITGVLMLAGIPVGTLIGILFMISLSRGKRLFGPDRFLHKALETEWKYRKRNGVE